MKRVFLISFFTLFVFSAFSQHQIRGKVLNESGEPLIGANVMIENTYRGTSTGIDGDFQFNNLKAGEFDLIVSYIGYQKEEITVNSEASTVVTVKMEADEIIGDEVVITATRASEKAPIAFTNVTKDEIEAQNLGQDIPYLLSLTPSLVSSSDAGTGIGYTSLRIRGTDANRINITVNGIPLNDAESHGVFWVNMPDLSTSVEHIQVQRGVGTSTNGAAAFGATINLQTSQLNKTPYAETSASYGSFNTLKNSVSAGTGLINEHFTFDARLSQIESDGYIDRAWSDLKSFYLSGAYYTGKTLLRCNVFSGEEHTYQAWYGVEESILDTNRTYNPYTYENETDNYIQTHYQLLFSRQMTKHLNANLALHYTQGEGYYEQMKEDELFADYQLEDVVIGADTIASTDLIRRKWLDNDFYGCTFSFNYRKAKTEASIGGGWNRYEGKHFGRVIWAEYASNSDIGHEWYNNLGDKEDGNLYAKINYQITSNFNLFADVQYRYITYNIDGIDDDLSDITQAHEFNFFNPKAGLFFDITDRQNTYFSFAIANREPNRANFVDATPSNETPVAETLYNYELGYNLQTINGFLGINFYYMDYTDQLVNTGELNDVGAPMMTNVPESYRMGIEVISGLQIFDRLNWEANFTLSQNRIKNYVEYATYYDENWNAVYDSRNLGETDISYSPNIIANSLIKYEIVDDLNINFISKYVGKQYFDNTSSPDRQLDAYFVNNLRIDYQFSLKSIKNISLQLLVNNIFDVEYESFAYGGNWYENGEEKTWAYYFPQAGINYLAGIKLRF